MLVADMMHSCSNDKVAKVAVACIGGSFADRVQACARENGLNSGKYVSLVVRHFARRADSRAYAKLSEKIAGADQPLLQGLRYIVESAMDDCAPFPEGESDSGSYRDSFGRRSASGPEACHLY